MKWRFTTWLPVVLTVHVSQGAPNPQTGVLTSTTGAVTSTSTPTGSATSSSSSATVSNDACAQLASLIRSSGSANPTNVTVPAQAAWDCLQAVPFDGSTALAWIESLRPYVRWQTTLAYLKDPPEGYLLPAHDVDAALDEIAATVQGTGYKNQYEFEFAIYNVFQQAYDGHFSYQPNLACNIVSFGRPFALVAVSSDGESLPKPYIYQDVLRSYNDSSFQPSAVAEIDGVDATTYLSDFSMKGWQHDPNALWNSLFLELAAVQLGTSGQGPGLYSGGGRGDVIYPNATTTLTLEDGTNRAYENTARLLISLSNVTSAQDLYQRYVNPTTVPRQTAAVRSPNATPAPGFPTPVVRDPYNLVSGYYLEGDDLQDVAVLSLPSFQTYINTSGLALTFLDQAKAAGKTKLIIDLSANGGGSVNYGFRLFAKLFPNLTPYLGTRFRATEVFDIIGQTVSDYSNGTANTLNGNSITTNRYSSFFNGLSPFPYASDVDENYEQFQSWSAKFGPHQYYGDNFTSIIQWNLSQPAMFVPDESTTNSSKPLFAAENIILLTDGYCASTCSNFVNMMVDQAGVNTVAVGGRPDAEPMQAVGGTRGSNNFGWSLIQGYVNLTYSLVNATQSLLQATNLFLNTEVGEYLGANGGDALIPFKRGGYLNSINVRDNIPRDSEDQIPQQFIYQAADCRIYWTMDMTVDITALWEKVADVSWGNDVCVSGGAQNSTGATLKRDSKQQSAKRNLKRRRLSPAELDALADSVNIWTDRDVDISGGGVTLY